MRLQLADINCHDILIRTETAAAVYFLVWLLFILFYSVAAVKTIIWHLLNSIQVTDGGVADPRFLSRIRIFPSRIQGQKGNGYGSATKNLISFNPIFIPDPDFFPIPDRDPGSRVLTNTGSADPDPQHC
jgi:hypothetical protein